MTSRADVGSLVQLAVESLAAGSPVSVLTGLLAFALLSGLGIVVGWGVLSLVRLPADPPRRLLLAPFAATVLWALAGNLLVRLGLTMAVASAVIGAVSLGVAAFAVGSAARLRRGSGMAALV